MIDIRFIEESEIPAFRDAISFGFGGDSPDDEDSLERFKAVFPLETSIAAFDGERVAATFGSFDFDVTVPGGTLPMAGTTVVTVHPPYRRRGILKTMMRMHLEQAVERRQPLAGLWASESTIYSRFGFGEAAFCLDTKVPANMVSLPKGPDSISVRFVTHDEAAELLPPLYDQVRLQRPGMLSRDEVWWANRRLANPTEGKDGASSRRIVVAYEDGMPVGYAAYRQKSTWEEEVAKGTVKVIEVIPTTDDARRALWDFLAHIDLFPTVHWWAAAVDEPLWLEVDNPRLVKATRFASLWIRILDVPAALGGRTYEADGTLVLDITDDFMHTAGRYRLSVAGGRATCTPTDDEPDVELDISVLGSLYLGGQSAYRFSRAGEIAGEATAVLAMEKLFRTAAAPFCGEVF